jgi:hypothetical protein
VKPAHRVYYGTNKGNLYRLDESQTGNPIPKNITGNTFPDGNIQSIAIDPRDADNMIIVFSNYNIISLFHSTDGGDSWTAIAGNLEDNPNGSGVGPSCRWAEIVPLTSGFKVYVGTSIGLFSTGNINGNFTCWEQEGKDVIGNAVITMMDIRHSDGYMALATHGAGVFTTNSHQLPPKISSPQLIYPAQDTNSNATLIRYFWEIPQGTIFSRLEVSEFPDFSQLTFTRSNIPAGLFTGLSGLKSGKRYFWRVFAVNSSGDSYPSETRTFTIGNVSDVKDAENDKIYLHDNVIYVSAYQQAERYSILDVTGRTMCSGILQSGESAISVAILSKGTYILSFPNKNNLKPFIFNK